MLRRVPGVNSRVAAKFLTLDYPAVQHEPVISGKKETYSCTAAKEKGQILLF